MDEMKTAIDLFASLPPAAQWVALIVVAAKTITPLTPTRHKNPVLDTLLRALNILALNVGKDKNEDSPTLMRYRN
jgi:hypothetical protein